MAHTLLEYAKTHSDPLQRGLIETFVSGATLLQSLPFQTVSSGTYIWDQEVGLPTTANRGINEAFSQSEGLRQRLTETCSIAGVDVVTDTALVERMGVQRHSQDVASAVKRLAHNFFAQMLTGLAGTKNFDGLDVRISRNNSNGFGTAIANNGASDALSLAKLDEAIDACEGDNKVIFMPKQLRRGLSAYLRGLGYAVMGTTGREFGVQLTTYNDIPIIETDPHGVVSAAISAGASSRVIVASLGFEGVFGIQVAPPAARFLGEIDTKPQLLTRVEWQPSIVLAHPRAAVSLSPVDTTDAVVA